MAHRSPADDAAQEAIGPEIRRMTVGDFDAVREVAHATWAATYRGIILEAEQAVFIQHAYSRESLGRRMERGVFLVAVWRDEVVGFADFAAPSDEDGDVELAALYVLPAMQGRGLGGRMLEEGMGVFPLARSVVLRVLRENAAGRRFYEERGFHRLGEHQWRLENGEVVVVVEMVREIGGRA